MLHCRRADDTVEPPTGLVSGLCMGVCGCGWVGVGVHVSARHFR